jgi:hypothetical protein
MTYNLTKQQLLEFANLVYEQSVNGYMDLKESSCEGLVANFLSDKKSSASNTHLSLTTNSVTTSEIFTSDVFTISDGMSINQNR